MSNPRSSYPMCLFPYSHCASQKNLYVPISKNPSPGEESPPPPLPRYEFSQKTPDGSGSFCWGVSVCFLCSSLFLDTHYSITHAPAALVSIFRQKCLNKLFMLVAIENEKPFRVSVKTTSFIIFTIFYIGKSCFVMETLKYLPALSEWWKSWIR